MSRLLNLRRLRSSGKVSRAPKSLQIYKSGLSGRRTEQAKANLDPRVGPRVAPRAGPRVDQRVRPRDRPRERPRQDPRGLIFPVFSPTRTPHESSRIVPRTHPRKCQRKCPVKWSRSTCPVFTCSVRRPLRFFRHFGPKGPERPLPSASESNTP